MTITTDGPTVTRWRKHGKDRLYVATAAGQRIGWWDLITREPTIELPSQTNSFYVAVGAFCAENSLPIPSPPASTAPQTAPADADPSTPVVPDWDDLAANRPGQGVRAQAEAERAAMLDRSRVGTFLARVLDTKTDERAYRVGADGEEAIGARLNKLTEKGWRVLHSVPVGKGQSDIDHIVIGPGGVFTINTKRHPNKSVVVGRNWIRVDGRKHPYLPKSEFEAQRASKLLTEACGFPVLVRAALVFLTGTVIPDVTIKSHPPEVWILDRMDVPGRFRRAKGKLSAEQVEAIYEQARRSSTWKC